MSKQYDDYLKQHIANVSKGYNWLRTNLSHLLIGGIPDIDRQISEHDRSKYIPDEYDAYDVYFYGKEKTPEVEKNFQLAWLQHIHRNPHHWQYWVLIHDDPDEGETIMEMPYNYIIEMICDWWSFSWESGDLFDIFDWYETHKENIIMSKNTQATVEDILNKLEQKLIKVRGPRK